MGRAEAIDMVEQSKLKDRAVFLRSLLDGLIYDGYRFPTSGNDGIIGPFTISKAMPLFLQKRVAGVWTHNPHDKLGLLAAHLNFGIGAGQLRSSVGELRINLSLLHLTVRRRKCQLSIDDDGPSGDTALESIHMNQNTLWDGRAKNLAALVHQLEVLDNVTFTGAEVVSFLQEYEGLTQAYMARAAAGLKDAIEKIIHINAGGGVRVVFDEDAAWTGR